MSALPYMPLYVADYLADTAHLTAIENGAYLMLIMNYWQRGKALPGGGDQLARIARVTREEWAQIGGALEGFFEVIDGQWVHSRIERELEKVRDKSVKASNAGKVSAQRKSNERSTAVQQTFNHTDTDTDTERKNARDAHDSFWEVCPKKVGKGASKKAWKGAILKTSPDTIIAAMRAFASKQAGKDEKYIPHPATWLSQERWQDADLAPKVVHVTAQVPVPEDSAAFKAWEKFKGKSIPKTDVTINGRMVRGWYFPTEFPPQEQAA